jgi:uncharacterized protein (TIGR00369 family)
MTRPPSAWDGTHADRLGLDYERFEDGLAVANLEVRSEHRNPPGICHGGAIFTLADDTMGAAVFGVAPAGHLPTATAIDIRFTRSARPGDRLRAEARVLTHGSRTAVAESRVTDEEGRLVALATGSFLFVAPR